LGPMTGNCDTVLIDSHIVEITVGFDANQISSVSWATNFVTYNSSTVYSAPNTHTFVFPMTLPVVGLWGTKGPYDVKSLGIITFDLNC
jgi:hypothetical protein